MSGDREILKRVYDAKSRADLKEAYDSWAGSYENDLLSYGYRGATYAAALIGRHLPKGAEPILDAGCGTGLIGETLAVAGFAEVQGLDLSPGMLEVARKKGCYRELHEAALGDRLDFTNDHFAAVTALGVFTKGHVGPEAFGELLRITRPGGHMVISVRVDNDIGAPILAAVESLSSNGTWRQLDATPAFVSYPVTEPDIYHRIFVFQVA